MTGTCIVYFYTGVNGVMVDDGVLVAHTRLV